MKSCCGGWRGTCDGLADLSLGCGLGLGGGLGDGGGEGGASLETVTEFDRASSDGA